MERLRCQMYLGHLLVQRVHVSRTRHPNGARSGRNAGDADPLTVTAAAASLLIGGRTIEAIGGGTVLVGGDWDNDGTIDTTDSTIQMRP